LAAHSSGLNRSSKIDMKKRDAKEFDLTECEAEPIRHLGLIQPHGCLIAANQHGQITHISDNLRYFLPISQKRVLGGTLQAFLTGTELEDLLPHVSPPFLQSGGCHVLPKMAEPHCAWTHWNGSRVLIEIEKHPVVPPDGLDEHRQQVELGTATLRKPENVFRAAQLAAELVSEISHYDRIMVYRFLEDWSGEVIAEVRREYAEPFLGLRYPASDIPPQARQLYLENLLRVVVDVASQPSAIISLAGETQPLDLSQSKLRSVSPFHTEYLKNMGVGAAASVSLVVEGRLWGLIACHNTPRKGMSWLVRESFGLIACALSEGIFLGQNRARQRSRSRVARHLANLKQQVQTPQDALLAPLLGAHDLTRLFRACGVALWSENGSIRLGETPDFQWIDAYARKQSAAAETLRYSRQLEETTDGNLTTSAANRIAGVISIRLCAQPNIVLCCFRPEKIQEILWGGDIRQPVLRNERLGKLSPRRSFAAYRELAQGKSAEWLPEEIEAARALGLAIAECLPSAESKSLALTHAFSEARKIVCDSSHVQKNFLDVLGEGVSLVFRSLEKDPVVQYVNQRQFELLDMEQWQSQDLGSLSDVLKPVGISEEILEDLTHRPQTLTISVGRQGLRHLFVCYKNVLEISDAQGVAGLSAMLFADTTRFERGREAIEAAEAQAQHLVSLKTAFLSNMSHEIRTPMNGIVGMIQILLDSDPTAEQKDDLEIMQRSSEALVTVINDILDLSRIESGGLAFESLPFDLRRLVRDVKELLQPKAVEKGIYLNAAMDLEAETNLKGDPDRPRQILINVVGNAVKFTQRGEVSIHVSCSRADSVTARAVFSVNDTGIGISEEQAAHVFEKFRQADQSTTRKYGGTGLGLSIAKQLVTQMGGRISFTSSLGQGSTFVITLPLLLQESAEMEKSSVASPDRIAQAKEPAGALQTVRILLADDNSFNQTALEAMLRRRGLELDFASSGQEAIDRWESSTYDLILMDCHMNGMDGYEATKAIRQAEHGGQRIPIVALTADVLPANQQRCKEAGMDDYLAKPVRLDTLRAAIEKWTAARHGG
jgi:light-regulated signal transduction histidine kinase (bacteriophytochrome)/ActR/RegA family two-component response regulator